MAMLLLLSVLVVLTQPPLSGEAEVTILPQKPLIDDCTLVTCSPVENGLPGRDGQDEKDSPSGEKGDPGEVGAPDVQGSAGTRGPPGPKGEKGAPGPAGPMGIPGIPGAWGLSGPKGDRDITALRQQVEALQEQVGRLLGAFLQYKKMELFLHGQSFGQKVFKAARFVKPFQEAQQVCAQAGGQLPSPRSAAENEALKQLVEIENKGAAFLSMTDSQTEGKFIYPGGESLVYSNWASGEPNNYRDNEDCAEMYTNGQWNDGPCEEKRLVICEFCVLGVGEAALVQEPGPDLCAANMTRKS
ncbi:pulmonary surfactant-associated protein D-like [Myotis yumanensis]|uniref:pulmonary surfactant-associated protein D-like n=2 Tax=Myotis yumanensis TaxID=159337 RepID=UPI0038D49E2A